MKLQEKKKKKLDFTAKLSLLEKQPSAGGQPESVATLHQRSLTRCIITASGLEQVQSLGTDRPVTRLGGAWAAARPQRLFPSFHRGFYSICSHIGMRLEPPTASCAASAGRKANNGSSHCGSRSEPGHMMCHSPATCSHCTPTHQVLMFSSVCFQWRRSSSTGMRDLLTLM